MGLFVSNVLFCQVTDKNGNQLKNKSDTAVEQLDNNPLAKSELVAVYRYLVELQKVRNNYLMETKKSDVYKLQISEYQNQLLLKDDMNANLKAYAEQVKPKWYQSEIAILAWVTGSIILTYAVVK